MCIRDRVSPMKIDPEVSESSPARQWSRVDLPDPEGPMIAVSWPAAKSIETSSRALTSVRPLPYSFTA